MTLVGSFKCNFSVRIYLQTMKHIDQSLKAWVNVAGHNTITVPDLSVFEVFKLKVRVSTKWNGSDVTVSATIQACSVDSCVEDVPLMKNVQFQVQPSQSMHKQRRQGMCRISYTQRSEL